MQITVLKSKIHRATVTHADLEYEGSVTIDRNLMDAAGIHEFEAVHIWNVTSGSRLQTYALKGERNSGLICVNGAAAHHVRPGDLVIIATFSQIDESAAETHQPRLVFVDDANRIKELNRPEIPGPHKLSVVQG